MVNPIRVLVVAGDAKVAQAVDSLRERLELITTKVTLDPIEGLSSMLEEPANFILLDAREEVSLEALDMVHRIKLSNGLPLVIFGSTPTSLITQMSSFDIVAPLTEKSSIDEMAATIEEAITSLNGTVRKSSRTEQFQLYTKIGNKLKRIDIDHIRYVEVEGKYCSIKVGDRRYNVKVSMKDLVARLRDPRFIRVSRNFVINMDLIEYIDTFNFSVKIDERDIPISRTYKDQLMGRIELI
jgi:DNA-binding LytR/AlgR family response regulator